MKLTREVEKEIGRLCSIFNITEDALLRQLLKIKSAEGAGEGVSCGAEVRELRDSFHTADGPLPIGLMLRKITRKGGDFRATVTRDGIEVRGIGTFPSLSSAAGKIMKHNENGWKFWQFQDESGNWQPIMKLKAN